MEPHRDGCRAPPRPRAPGRDPAERHLSELQPRRDVRPSAPRAPGRLAAAPVARGCRARGARRARTPLRPLAPQRGGGRRGAVRLRGEARRGPGGRLGLRRLLVHVRHVGGARMSGGGIRTQPGRSVSTAASRRDAQERQRLADTELERVRRAAAAWQTGLAALLGVVTVVPVVKGRETIVGISPEAGILVGVLLGLALIAGTSGLCLALRAAHGLPATRRGGDAGRVARLQAASAAADDLRRAIAATVLTVAAI